MKEESRQYKWSPGRSEMGRSSIYITCPFCSVVVEAFVWSLAGSGKKCACGAIHYYLLGDTVRINEE